MAVQQEILFRLLVIGLILLNTATIFAAESPHSSAGNFSHILCDELLAEPNSGILHIVGRLYRHPMKSGKTGKGRQDDGALEVHKFPLVLLSTAAGDVTACQEIVDVDASGRFQADVAVSSDPASWAVSMSACMSGNGRDEGSRCRTVDIPSPDKQSSDGCHPAATRVAPTGKDHLDKTHYLAKVDFRSCVKRHSSNVKQRVVAVHRSRRQVGVYPDGEGKKTVDRHEERDLDELVRGAEDISNGRPSTDRHFYERQQTHRAAPKNRGNTQGTGRVPVSLENQPRMQRVDGTQMWREMSNNQEQMGSDQEAKRRWEKSGMSWMKKNSDQRPWDNDGNPGDEDSDSKRRWEKGGMSWIKRLQLDENAKRRWKNSGMSWMKRPAYDSSSSNYNNDNRDTGEPAETVNRRWENPGYSWIEQRK